MPEGCHWRDVRKVAVNVWQALQTALRGIEQANPHKLYGIFGDAQWTNKDRLSVAMLCDLVECDLGLGPNFIYNSPMEACVVVCRTQKPKARRRKILFINAVNGGTREHAQSFFTDDHLQRIVRAYQEFQDKPASPVSCPLRKSG